MVHLSANGEVIGRFEAKELPAVLAGGRVPPEAFFWREGMPEWRPLRELVLPPLHRPSDAAAGSKIEPIRQLPLTTVKPVIKPKLKIEPGMARRPPSARPPFLPRPRADADGAPAAPPASRTKPDTGPPPPPPSAGQSSVPRQGPRVEVEPAPAPVVPDEPVSRPAAAKRRGAWLAPAAVVLLLLGGGGAAAWWFFFAEPPPLSGEVRVAGAGGEMVPAAGAAVFLVAREELAARWRRQSEEIRDRAAQFEALLEAARAAHREKSLVLELADDVSAVADEYNMPDAEQLRAERDAAQAAEAGALAEVERLKREKDSISGPAAFLGAPPEAIRQTVTDESGAFRLPHAGPLVGLAVLVIAEPTADAAPVRAWFAPLDPDQDRAVTLRFSPDNALDAGQIQEMAGAAP